MFLDLDDSFFFSLFSLFSFPFLFSHRQLTPYALALRGRSPLQLMPVVSFTFYTTAMCRTSRDLSAFLGETEEEIFLRGGGI